LSAQPREEGRVSVGDGVDKPGGASASDGPKRLAGAGEGRNRECLCGEAEGSPLGVNRKEVAGLKNHLYENGGGEQWRK
ncbi:MAG TPA: hypothetical protein VLB32_02045, partial [Candidatus Acidoferrales bacterium]|nr:hypothetical protein [Candidatus Acidoferrales bacterium]